MKPVHCSYMVETEEKIITFEELLEMASVYSERRDNGILQ